MRAILKILTYLHAVFSRAPLFHMKKFYWRYKFTVRYMKWRRKKTFMHFITREGRRFRKFQDASPWKKVFKRSLRYFSKRQIYRRKVVYDKVRNGNVKRKRLLPGIIQKKIIFFQKGFLEH